VGPAPLRQHPCGEVAYRRALGLAGNAEREFLERRRSRDMTCRA
jgi:hypothetical protein